MVCKLKREWIGSIQAVKTTNAIAYIHFGLILQKSNQCNFFQHKIPCFNRA